MALRIDPVAVFFFLQLQLFDHFWSTNVPGSLYTYGCSPHHQHHLVSPDHTQPSQGPRNVSSPEDCQTPPEHNWCLHPHEPELVFWISGSCNRHAHLRGHLSYCQLSAGDYDIIVIIIRLNPTLPGIGNIHCRLEACQNL